MAPDEDEQALELRIRDAGFPTQPLPRGQAGEGIAEGLLVGSLVAGPSPADLDRQKLACRVAAGAPR